MNDEPKQDCGNCGLRIDATCTICAGHGSATKYPAWSPQDDVGRVVTEFKVGDIIRMTKCGIGYGTVGLGTVFEVAAIDRPFAVIKSLTVMGKTPPGHIRKFSITTAGQPLFDIPSKEYRDALA